MAGRVGRALVEPGNLVSASGDHATLLTTIMALDPIDLSFEMDQRNYLRYQRLLREKQVEGIGSPLTMRVADEQGVPHAGTLDSFEHQVNPQTGTIRIHGRFPNPGGLLLPGMFATVRMSFGPPQPVLEVPEEAVGSDRGQHYVLVVNDRNVVERRPVRLGQIDANRFVIEQGLRPNDWVIGGGGRGPRPGDQVRPQRSTVPGRPVPGKD